MRRLATNILLEGGYPGVFVGAILGNGTVMLVDIPLRIEDGRDWLTKVSEFGDPRYLVLLDQHPDRVLGGRGLDVIRVAHDHTRSVMSSWPDTFKGSAQPIGAESDRIKRITGVSKATPDLSFADKVKIHLGSREVHLWHRPGPTPGSVWVLLPDDEVVFIGDTVTISEPPYIGEADVEGWLASLEELRGAGFSSYRFIASRDGLIGRDSINAMARFVRKIPVRIGRMEKREAPLEAAGTMARGLLADFKVAASQRDMATLRLEAGLQRLYRRLHPGEE